jgi:branched-chain amino acid transport system ATP-binding protein
LAPLVVRQMLDQLIALKATGKTILLSEQNLHFSLQLADRAYIIEKGEIKYEGGVADLRDNTQIREEYLMI